MKRYIFTLIALLLLFGFGSCSENNELSEPENGRNVKLTVYATRGSADSRAALNEESGNLNCSWEEGDWLLVTNTKGGVLGQLCLTDKEEGKFEGSLVGLNEDKMVLNYFYLGSGASLEPVSGSHNVDIAMQGGTMDDLAKNDVLSAQAEVAIIDGNAYVSGTLVLGRHFSFGHFTLEFSEGVTMDGESVAIAGENVMTQASVGLADRSVSSQTAGTITVAGSDGDFYINLIPATGVAPTFTVTIDGTEYEGTLSARDIEAGIYLRKQAGVGIPVTMKKKENESENPSNPGNTEHWGGDNIEPKYIENNVTKVSETDGWTLNVRSLYNYGGFGEYVTYESNGIQSNLLTSKGTVAYYFQWGRWLGFPTSCRNTVFYDTGYARGSYPNTSQYLPNGVIYNTKVGYIDDMKDIIVSYASCYMGNTSWTNERVLRSSIIFGMVSSLNDHLDYAGANENCKWEDRSGNPCPDGYRIPTATELEALIPSTGQINGSYAEVKDIDGIKYAMQWKVNTNGTLPCVEIRSVKTTVNTVSIDDAAFNSAKVIKLYAYGYLNNEAELSSRGSIGVYWSCESGQNSISGTTGYGGKYLEIDFNGSNAVMGIDVAPRSFGAPVLPIKDPDVKSNSITPWFPVNF